MDKELIGLGAYFAINAHGRLIKDSQLAPSLGEQIDLARIAQGAWKGFEFLEGKASAADLDVATLMRPSAGLVDLLEERLRPSDWWDRVAKTYVSLGVLADLWCLLAEKQGLTSEITDPVRDVWGHQAWAGALIAAGDPAEPTLQARLSLWGRRVVGDVLSTAMRAVAGYPGLAGLVEAERDDVLAALTSHHAARMEAAGLKG